MSERGVKIMVVDDEPDIRRLINFTLARHGYEVVEAQDGEEALSVAVSQRPDLVLMDVMMPVMNGYDALRKMKEDPATADIPVVMLSAKSQVAEQEEGLAAGAARYITKPFTPKELLSQVEEYIRQDGSGG